MSAATLLFSWLVFVGGDTVRRCFRLGPDSGASGLFISGLCLTSGLSCWDVQSVEILTTYSAGQAVAVGSSMPLSGVSSIELFAAYPTGIGLCRIYMGLLMPGQASLLCKYFATFLTGEYRHGLSKTQNTNDDSVTVYIVRTRRN
jgi:hypothetical protein